MKVTLPSAVLVAALAVLSGPVIAAGPPADDCPGHSKYQGPAPRKGPALPPEDEAAFDGVPAADMVAALDHALERVLEQSGAPAIGAAVAIPGEGTWSRTRGLARVDPPQAATADSVFQVASATKLFTAALVLQLVQGYELRLDTTVEKWFPQVPNADRITIEHLLTHTSGVVSFNAIETFDRDLQRYRFPGNLIALAAEQRARFCPGASWEYSNTGYVMLGQIVASVRQAPLEDVLQQRIVEPLGLTHTRLRMPEDEAGGIVTGHRERKPLTGVEYATPYAAGGVASTPRDLLRMLHALLTGKLVKRSAVERMLGTMYPMSDRMFYGQGIQLYDIPDGPGLLVGHSGGMPGFTSVVAWVPADDVWMAVTINDQTRPAEAGLWALLQAVREARAQRESAGGE